MNGFNKIAADDNQWASRSLPPTPEQFAANLGSEVNALKDAISMPARTRPWQKTMEFVDGLKRKLPDEELAVIRRYVERRSREAARVTATLVSTVQHCIPQSLNPEMPPYICINLESNESKIDPKLKELESPSAGTGLETPGQQCTPNAGTWEKGRTIADGDFLVGMGSNQGESSLHPRNAWTREPAQKLRQHLQHQTPFPYGQEANPKTRRHAAKKTNSSTLVGKEESSYHLGTRL